MRRFHFVAYDVRPVSPAEPRVAAVVAEMLQRGSAEAVLYSAHEPGGWARRPGLELVLVPEPVAAAGRLVKRVLGGRRNGASVPGRNGEAAREMPAFITGLARKVLFPDNQAPWAMLVARALARRVCQGDVVMTFSPPESVGLAGRLAQRRGARWWSDFADGWCFQGLRREAMKPGPRRSLELALERRWVRQADAVSTVNGSIAEWLNRLRSAPDVLLFPNIIPPELEDAPPARGAGARARAAIGYLGRLACSDPERSLRPFLELLARWERPAALRFVFRGQYGRRDREEIEALRRLGHDVDVEGAVPRRELVALRDSLDALLVVLSPEQRGSSSKLLDALGLDLPLFALAHPESLAARIVREVGCGEVAPLDDPEKSARRWGSFLARVHDGSYHADAGARFTYGSASCVPGVVDRLAALPVHEAEGIP